MTWKNEKIAGYLIQKVRMSSRLSPFCRSAAYNKPYVRKSCGFLLCVLCVRFLSFYLTSCYLTLLRREASFVIRSTSVKCVLYRIWWNYLKILRNILFPLSKYSHTIIKSEIYEYNLSNIDGSSKSTSIVKVYNLKYICLHYNSPPHVKPSRLKQWAINVEEDLQRCL